MVLVGEWLGFYGQERALESINFPTLELLLGMMILVGLLQRTGFFEYLSIKVARRSGHNQFKLFLALCGLTAGASAILDNITTMVLVAPMTLAIADVLDISPVPYLIGEAMMSMMGGMATLVGDPPNIIIGSAAGISFNSFLIHLGPISVFTWVASAVLFWFIFGFSPVSDQKVQELRNMAPEKALDEPDTVLKLIWILIAVVLLYITHSYLGIEPGLVALLGATIALVFLQPDIQETLQNIEWDVIAFLAGLFVVIGGLESVGLLSTVAEYLQVAFETHPTLAPIGLLWVAGILSAVVDNIPFTIAMVPIVLQIQGVPGPGLLWWALAMGAALGGAGSPIGSSANVVAISMSERSDYPIDYSGWVKIGIPVAFLNLSLASLYLVVLSLL